jgi:hypothetical protein
MIFVKFNNVHFNLFSHYLVFKCLPRSISIRLTWNIDLTSTIIPDYAIENNLQKNSHCGGKATKQSHIINDLGCFSSHVKMIFPGFNALLRNLGLRNCCGPTLLIYR